VGGDGGIVSVEWNDPGDLLPNPEGGRRGDTRAAPAPVRTLLGRRGRLASGRRFRGEVVRVKDRFVAPADSGYRDILMNM
jgi:hypothetical protein